MTMKVVLIGVLSMFYLTLSEAQDAPSVNCTILVKEACCNQTSCQFISCNNTEPICTSTDDTQCDQPVDMCEDIDVTTEQPETSTNQSTVTPTSEPVSPSDKTTTQRPLDLSTTEATPIVTTASPPPSEATSETTSPTTFAPTTTPEGQRFDAASFIGGIVLCGGVVAIIFFSLKFYQSRSDNRYSQF